LHQGAYDEVVERAGEPVALARAFAQAGAARIHLVDLDGARSGRVRPELVREVAAAVSPAVLQASGGIRSLDDARALLEAGAGRAATARAGGRGARRRRAGPPEPGGAPRRAPAPPGGRPEAGRRPRPPPRAGRGRETSRPPPSPRGSARGEENGQAPPLEPGG